MMLRIPVVKAGHIDCQTTKKSGSPEIYYRLIRQLSSIRLHLKLSRKKDFSIVVLFIDRLTGYSDFEILSNKTLSRKDEL